MEIVPPTSPTCKTCARCKQLLSVSLFRKDQKMRDGYYSYCNPCRAEYNRIERAKNKDRCNVYARVYYVLHREEISERGRIYKLNNRERINQRILAWIHANRARVYSKYHARSAKKITNGGNYTVAEWNELKQKHEHKCLRCGRHESEAKLTIDHVKPVSLGGSNDISNLQPLCKSCNSSKKDKWIDYR